MNADDLLVEICAMPLAERRRLIAKLLLHADSDPLADATPPKGVLPNFMRELQAGLVWQASSFVSQVIGITCKNMAALEAISLRFALLPYRQGPEAKKQKLAKRNEIIRKSIEVGITEPAAIYKHLLENHPELLKVKNGFAGEESVMKQFKRTKGEG